MAALFLWLCASAGGSHGALRHRTLGENEYDQAIHKMIAKHDVTVLSKSYCVFCKETRRSLSSLDPSQALDMSAYDLDATPENTDKLQDALERLTGVRSVPAVFVRGSYIGGHDDTDKAIRSGRIQTMLSLPHDKAAQIASIQPIRSDNQSSEHHLKATELTRRSDFDDFLNAHQVILLDVYKIGCHACDSIAPTIDAVSRELLSEGRIAVAKIKASSNALPDEYQQMVPWYPTLLIVQKGHRPVPYSGGHSVVALVSTLKSMMNG